MKARLFTFIVLCICSCSSMLCAQNYQDVADKALVCIKKDSLGQAEVLLKQAVKMEPSNSHNALLFANLGWVQHKLGKIDDALNSYKQAIDLAPNALPIILDRAAVYMEKGMAEYAYADYIKVLEQDKTNKEALQMCAYICMNQHNYKDARRYYNRLLAKYPTDENSALGLINLNQKEGRLREALDLATELITFKPSNPLFLMARANVEKDLNLSDLALLDLDDVIKINPRSIEAFILRGDIFFKLNNKQKAKEDFLKAIELGASDPNLRAKIKMCK